jgi:hypothetical protein
MMMPSTIPPQLDGTVFTSLAHAASVPANEVHRIDLCSSRNTQPRFCPITSFSELRAVLCVFPNILELSFQRRSEALNEYLSWTQLDLDRVFAEMQPLVSAPPLSSSPPFGPSSSHIIDDELDTPLTAINLVTSAASTTNSLPTSPIRIPVSTSATSNVNGANGYSLSGYIGSFRVGSPGQSSPRFGSPLDALRMLVQQFSDLNHEETEVGCPPLSLELFSLFSTLSLHLLFLD